MSLEADGIIDVWEIETGRVVAQYEGLEVHEDMQSIPDMKRRISELLAQVQAIPVAALRRLVDNAEWTPDAEYTAGQYLTDWNKANDWLKAMMMESDA